MQRSDIHLRIVGPAIAPGPSQALFPPQERIHSRFYLTLFNLSSAEARARIASLKQLMVENEPQQRAAIGLAELTEAGIIAMQQIVDVDTAGRRDAAIKQVASSKQVREEIRYPL